MRQYKFKINGNNYQVHIKTIEDNVVTLEVNGSEYDVELEKDKVQTKTPRIVRPVTASQPSEPPAVKAKSAKLNRVQAPLPGTVLELKVKEGDAVTKGTLLMVMEAMKMENNILADVDGTITSIKVKDGQTVLQGDTLIEIG
jgi:biotin carboxyl carrier protein